MKNVKKVLFFLPFLLLASCNFKYTYVIAGEPTGGGGAGADEEDDGIEDAGSYDIKIWVADEIVDLTRMQIQMFVAESGGKYDINPKVEPVSEGSAATSMLQDVESGADIFVFAQDQLSRLKVAGAVSKLTGNYASFIKKNNSEDSVKAASIDGTGETLYAFPTTSDNGYFLYYDKRIIPDADANDMTKILADCKAANKKLNFTARSDGFYAASYFLAKENKEDEPICHSTWHFNELTASFDSYDDNFAENGLFAAKGLKELDNTSLVANNALASKLGDTAAAVVSGIWEYAVASQRLKENLGCAELPYFSVDGKRYHLGSFDGYKLMGVKPQLDQKKASVCRKLARYLTGDSCQTQRFQKVAWGPTNIKSNQREEIATHPGLSALYKQHEYATQQGQCPGAWFVALSTAAKSVKNNASDAELQKVLNNYKSGLAELLDED